MIREDVTHQGGTEDRTQVKHMKVRGGKRKTREEVGEQQETTNESTGNRNRHGKRQKINLQTITNTANKLETTVIHRQND